ncbi:MAG: hemolysin III family protein [Oscillospiraceae bacterium]|nr:hemolysin III family protein [Oscillospiraceae bacterium]
MSNHSRAERLSRIELPNYTRGEEIFNMTSHIVGGALGITATTLCVIMAALHANVYGVISGAIYGGMMIILYCMSSIYHGLKPELKAKKVFRILDHCAIYLLIAGTYTPFTLCTIREANTALGWVYFGIQWGLAAAGIVLNAIDMKKFKVVSMLLYLGLGWCIVFTINIVLASIGIGGLVFLLTGGVSYTIGAVIYGAGKKHAYMHSVFHLFVVVGSLLHFFCILFYVM